ncbi:MAG: 30S ribosomal protein S4 [Candidatus Roseilinea sp.]
MARHIEPVCRLCRREGEKLFLKGERCLSPKCAVDKRGYFPGQHGPNAKARRAKMSDYQMQLREKQKLRRIYGVLESQFRRYFRQALKARGVTGAQLLTLLERRLDNVVYRAGFAASRPAARQLVTHAHFYVNGHPVDIPSYLVRPGDTITVRETSRGQAHWKQWLEQKSDIPTPRWLNADRANLSATVQALPTREDIDVPIKEQLVVEFYSR